MKETEKLTIEIKVRLAKPADFKIDDRHLNIGQVFWVRSLDSKKFQNQPMRLTEDTDVHEIAAWLINKMIFVPVTWAESFDDN